MTALKGMIDPNTRKYGDPDDVIEALAIWHCNRQSKRIRDGGGAASWFHECLPSTQEHFRDWARDVVNLIAKIKR